MNKTYMVFLTVGLILRFALFGIDLLDPKQRFKYC